MNVKKILVFVSIWMVNSCIYMCKKFMGATKTRLGWDKEDLGFLDLSVSIPAAIGTLFLGFLTKNNRPHHILIAGCVLQSLAILLALFGTEFGIMITIGIISGISTCLVIPASNFFYQRSDA